MILKVGYCPFPNDAQLKEMNERLIAGHNSAHTMDQFRPDIVLPGNKALQSVMRFQQLYIFAHGSSGSTSVEDSTGGSMTLVDLANQLRDQKLTVSIQKVKLWVCEGGVGGESSMAQAFKSALVAAGFTDVTVYGYLNLLGSGINDDGHKFVGDYDWNTQSWSNTKTASQARVKF